MSAKSSTLSSTAAVFTPQGASGYLEYTKVNYGGYGYENSFQHYMSAGAMPFSPQHQQHVLNLDDFSDLSDSDDEEPVKVKEIHVDHFQEVSEKKPAEEPAPSTLGDSTDLHTESALSSTSSEPEQEEREPVYDIRQLLEFRKALSHEPQIILYRTMVESKPEAASEPKKEITRPKLRTSETSWAAQQRRAKLEAHDSSGQVARSIKSILNKLTLEKFGSLSEQLLRCGMSCPEHLTVLIHEVFEKATTQHHFIDMYADLCVLLHEHFTLKPLLSDQKLTFKRLLLDECQGSFERLLSPPVVDALPDSERAAVERSYKTHMLGNIKLVGALLARGIVAAKVGIVILEELLSNPTPEALESIAALLTAMGAAADRPEWAQKTALNQIFERIALIVEAKSCQPRERCLLKDLLELRANGWEQRRPKPLEKAKTLAELADERPFDRPLFRGAARRLLRGAAAWPELRAAGRPPSGQQPLEVAEMLSHVVQERCGLRPGGFEALLSIANEWHAEALAQGVKLFVTDLASDLALDVPNLPEILQEFSSLLRARNRSPASQQALNAYQKAIADAKRPRGDAVQ